MADVQAPGSAGPLMKKIVYGLGFIGIMMSTVLYTHVSTIPAMIYKLPKRLIHDRSTLPNTSSSKLSEALDISLPIPGNIGPYGSAAQAAYVWWRM